ncbi:MAG: RNA polymerase sigma factor [Thermoleophilia bacterium]|nr:RNA polymerase sigma factor [Thermoleophilia bacterium]
MTLPATDRERRFAEVYAAQRARVFAYALRRVHTLEEAEDVVADTFLVAWRRLEAMPGTGALTWLLGVARRVIADRQRAEARRDALAQKVQEDAPMQIGTEDQEQPVSTEAELALCGLARLSENDREVLLLVAWDDLSHRQAAAVLGCNMATFTVRFHRARKRLAEAMKEESGGERGFHERALASKDMTP